MHIAGVRGRAARDRLLEWAMCCGCQVDHNAEPELVVPPARPAVSPFTLAALERTCRAFGLAWSAP